ncbi:MAG: hypothetical protein FWF81_08590 [Defluviitaleaceae bacterium]|nr:hypothetical protein [Defluviitaleaceae bacterium]
MLLLVGELWGYGAVGRTDWSVNTPEEILRMTGIQKVFPPNEWHTKN